ncbi:MAG: hypothetical protein LBK56_00470 [Gracilibacteraceae bacterium]|nr:hypothetical protein [Gracilibacteraceae bacterium]
MSNAAAWKVAKINLKNIQIPCLITAICVAAMLAQTSVKALVASGGGDMSGQLEISGGCFLWLLPLLAAIFVPAKNFRRIVNLGGKRGHFLRGALMAYAVLAAAVSAGNMAVHYAFDLPMIATGYFEGVVNLVDVFGWTKYGVIAAFVQQAAFLFLLAVFTHTLTAAQGKWYGLAADILIIAVVSVFTPIAPLRAVLAGFFRLILFAGPLPQTAACLLIAAALWALNKPVLARTGI